MKKMKVVIFAAALVIGFTSLAGTSSANYVGQPSCWLVGPCLDDL